MSRRGARGFTLIETVISLVLLSFIAIIGYQGLAFGVKHWRIGHDQMRHHYDFHQAIGWMRDKLGTASKVRSRVGKGRFYLFDGTPQSVEFVARFDRTRRSGLYVSKVYFDANANAMYVSYYLHHPDVTRNPENIVPERVVLLADVETVRISYYGTRRGSRKTAWHENWREQTSLPKLIKLEIESVDGVKHRSLLSMLTSN